MIITSINHPGNVLMNDHPQNHFYQTLQDNVNADNRFNDQEQVNQTTLAGDITGTIFTWNYYYDPDGGYKNAVWISNNRPQNHFIYILINELGNKKARIWSENQIENPQIQQELRTDYCVPLNFNNQGLWVEMPNQVTPIDNDTLLEQIYQRMQLICQL